MSESRLAAFVPDKSRSLPPPSPTEEPHAMIVEPYTTASGETFDIEIAPAPADGKRYPVVVLIHGNLGLADPFGTQLRKFTEDIAKLGYLAALPAYYPKGHSDRFDTNIPLHMPALTAAIEHLRDRHDADIDRLGLVGFSLGGGIAMSYIASSPAGTVKVFADFFGLIPPGLLVPPMPSPGVAKFPPTIIFNNGNDPVVPVAQNSEPLADALTDAKIEHQPVRPYRWFNSTWERGGFHAFKPGDPDDVNSRAATEAWLQTHMPPTGKP